MTTANQSVVNPAIVAFLQRGAAASPRADRSAVAALVHDSSGPEVIAEVERLVQETIDVPVEWRNVSLGDAGRAAGAEMLRRHPWLSAEALDALQWAFTFAWR